MRKTVVGTFDSGEEAEQVAVLLIEHGVDRGDIAVRATGATTGTTTSSHESASWWDWLFGESEDRSYYSERMNRGGAILAVTTDEEGAGRARRLMEAEGGDLEPSERSDAAPTRTVRQASAPRGAAAGQPEREEVLPVVEERLRTGKRPVASGAVRVYRRVTERPVEERVPLREEHVRVERRPADRPIGDPAAAFREDVIEVEETAGTERSAPQGDDGDFRRHWTETGRARGLSYEQSGPAYRFGHELAGDGRDDDRDWSAIEPEARRRW